MIEKLFSFRTRLYADRKQAGQQSIKVVMILAWKRGGMKEAGICCPNLWLGDLFQPQKIHDITLK